MQITLTEAGKRYNREWIFRKVSAVFQGPAVYAITGPNGSGKSTLLQVMAGSTPISEGTCQYQTNEGIVVADEHVFRHIAYAAPYLELIEEMTATELLQFHQGFQPMSATSSIQLESVGLASAAHKQIRYFSSGMKQRLKLAQAFFSSTPVLFLDEPTANLDAAGAAIYQHLLHTQAANRLVIIASNDPQEYQTASNVLDIAQFK
jgi:ABC-type multidrug transport system ATPase subunit